jgi:hypothetical protein
MDGIACDMCGGALLVNSDVRYEVTIEVKAAYDPLELTRKDLERDFQAEMRRLLEQMHGMTPEEAQNQVYRVLKFDLCPPCQKVYLERPMPGRG